MKLLQLKINDTVNDKGISQYFLMFNRNVAYQNTGQLPNFLIDKEKSFSDDEILAADDEVPLNIIETSSEDEGAGSSFCRFRIMHREMPRKKQSLQK